MNLKGRKAGLVMLLFFIAIILFFIFWGSSDSPESTAKFAAEKLVKDKLKAPSTANFISAEIIDQKDDLYLVKVTADAQNSFGAMIRGNFLVVVKVNVSGPYLYSDYPNVAVQEVSNPPTEEEIRLTKWLNNWNSSWNSS